MKTTIERTEDWQDEEFVVIPISKASQLKPYKLSSEETEFVKQQKKSGKDLIEVNRLTSSLFIYFINDSRERENYHVLESARVTGHKLSQVINHKGCTSMVIADGADQPQIALALAEGIALSQYQFLKYFKDQKKRAYKLEKINLTGPRIYPADLIRLSAVVAATCHARDLVNEPLSYLTAEQMAEDIKKLGRDAGYKTEVFNKKKIESLKMGGLLAVNRGSFDPPTFSVLEWKPENPVNDQPYVLVGKGVVYDTGGLSLKPTPNGMDEMKSDMGGAAAVIGALYAVSKANLNVHVIGLVPATDNRPGNNAYAPGDVIKMFNGSTVEVLNTDAEGRMLLADALAYAKKYNPELVIDLATLTGAAVRAVGIHGIAGMGTSEKALNQLVKSGFQVYERVAPQPFWDEYGDEMKSDIADLKNIGGPNAGAITAGKFLQHFTQDNKGKSAYPWVHLDIAGPAFLHQEHSYRGKWGTGTGVRLLFDFFKNLK